MGFNLKIGRFIVGVLLTAAMLGFSGCASSTTVRATTNATAANSGYFTIAVLPDTQYYSCGVDCASYPELFKDQMRWIIANRDRYNIQYVVQLGDIVNTSTPPFFNATLAMFLESSSAWWTMIPATRIRSGKMRRKRWASSAMRESPIR